MVMVASASQGIVGLFDWLTCVEMFGEPKLVHSKPLGSICGRYHVRVASTALVGDMRSELGTQ